MTGERDRRWLASEPDHGAPLRLFCFPHAGAGAGAYRAWATPLARAGVAVCAVQPPGRETRFREPLCTRLDTLVDAVVPALAPHLGAPYALFGHSLGALVAFEVARRLRTLGAPPPARLLVSGRIAPQLADTRRRLHDLPEGELLGELQALGGIPPAFLEHRELLALQLPVLRADLALNENYRHPSGEPLAVPISAFGGDRDPKVDERELRAWGEQTEAGFRARLLPGDHFFVSSALPLLLRDVADDLSVVATAWRSDGARAAAS